jgi:hypothetical protein
MKCPSCSAENEPNAAFCEYCGTALGKMPTANQVYDKATGSETAVAATGTSSNSGFWPATTDPAFQLWTNKSTTPENSFNWLAFFFPVGYLAGYGAIRSAVAVILSTLALFLFAGFVAGLAGQSFHTMSRIALLVSLVYAYRIATHVDGIIGTSRESRDKSKFNWVAAIGLTIFYSIAFNGIA